MKKLIAVGIIVLFISVGLSPVIPAVDNNARDDELNVIFDVSESYDDYEEIITLISSIGSITTIKRLGLFLREVRISSYIIHGGSIALNGLRRSNGRVEIYHESGTLGIINASRFIGFSLPREVGFYILGIAFGNIEYSLSNYS